MARQIILTLGFIVSVVMSAPLSPSGSTQWTYDEIPPSKSLIWYPCFSNFSCAVLDVPLDYQKPEGHRATVPILKSPATIKPYKGILLANPGGPGVSGITWMMSKLSSLTAVVGKNYDFLNWDPRGVGLSIPSASCEVGGVSVRSKIPKIHGPEFRESDLAQTIINNLESGRICASQIGGGDQAGPHMTTAIVARDMISILDAFAKTKPARQVENPLLLNYWGISYGTMLGQTFASMFPNRVGRVVLDAVVDPDDFVSGAGLSEIIDADEAFSKFFEYCHAAGPAKCSFYRKTPKDVYNRFKTLLYRLDPIEAEKSNSDNLDVIKLTLHMVRDFSYASVYGANRAFPFMADALSRLEVAVGKGLSWQTFSEWFDSLDLSLIFEEGGDASSSFWSTGVRCTDRKPGNFNRTLEHFLPQIREYKKQSYIGSAISSIGQLGCVGWSIRSNDAYEGPFGGKTKNPILFVGTTFDSITPLANAKKGARIFNKAEVLTVDGVGHGTVLVGNKCGLKKLNTFFQTGKLPGKKGSYCPLEAGPWGITLKGPLGKRTIDSAKALAVFEALKN